MTVTSMRPPRAKKESAGLMRSETPLERLDGATGRSVPLRSLALDAGNYDLKYWEGVGSPRAIRSSLSGASRARSGAVFGEFAVGGATRWTAISLWNAGV